MDALIQATQNLEAATDDYTFGVFVNVTNPDPEDVPISILKGEVVGASILVVIAMTDADVTLFSSAFATSVIPPEIRETAARAETAARIR